MSNKDTIERRTVLKSLGVAGAFTAIPGAAIVRGELRSNVADEGMTPMQEPRTIEWDGQRGSEHADPDCASDEQACWHWVLTRGGNPNFSEIGELEVTFEDGVIISVAGSQGGEGQGAVHFDVCRLGGGEVVAAEVDIVGGGPNAHLTISDVECTPTEVEEAHWQLDFAAGDEPNDPPKYWPDDLMAGLGNTVDGVLQNPSMRRANEVGQLGDVMIDDNAFQFDDEDDPTEVTVSFTIEDGAPTRDLHLALFELPGSFDPDEVEDQEYVRHDSGTFSGGDSGSLTISMDLS